MSQIRAVFCDLDDTLCDTIGTREARARIAFERLHDCLDLDEAKFVAQVLEPIKGDRAVRGLRTVLEEIGLQESEPFRQALDLWFFVGCDHLLQPFPGVPETIVALSRSHVLGIVTNGEELLQQSKLRRIGLDSYFQFAVASASVGCEKPDARIFAHACSQAGVRPEEAVFVGDRVDIDVAGAKASGMRAVWFNHWGGALKDSDVRPDAVIERFAELPGIIEAL